MQNDWIGPPSTAGGVTRDVVCFSDWICEHRWRQIFNMVDFHNAARDQRVTNWWDNGHQAGASNPYKRWRKCTMEKVGGGRFCRNLGGVH